MNIYQNNSDISLHFVFHSQILVGLTPLNCQELTLLMTWTEDVVDFKGNLHTVSNLCSAKLISVHKQNKRLFFIGPIHSLFNNWIPQITSFNNWNTISLEVPGPRSFKFCLGVSIHLNNRVDTKEDPPPPLPPVKIEVASIGVVFIK
jgi:hypothetical protein